MFADMRSMLMVLRVQLYVLCCRLFFRTSLRWQMMTKKKAPGCSTLGGRLICYLGMRT